MNYTISRKPFTGDNRSAGLCQHVYEFKGAPTYDYTLSKDGEEPPVRCLNCGKLKPKPAENQARIDQILKELGF